MLCLRTPDCSIQSWQGGQVLPTSVYKAMWYPVTALAHPLRSTPALHKGWNLQEGDNGHLDPTPCRPRAGPVAGLHAEWVVLKLPSII